MAVAVDIVRGQPGRTGAWEAVGYLLGLLLGWFAAGRLIRRGRLTMAFAAVGVVLLLPGTVIATIDLVAPANLPDTAPPYAPWGDYLFWGVRLLTTLGVVALLAAALVGLRPRRRGRPAVLATAA